MHLAPTHLHCEESKRKPRSWCGEETLDSEGMAVSLPWGRPSETLSPTTSAWDRSHQPGCSHHAELWSPAQTPPPQPFLTTGPQPPPPARSTVQAGCVVQAGAHWPRAP